MRKRLGRRMAEWVVDTSAVLAFVFGEPGGAEMEPLFDKGMISAVNLSEVIGKMIDRRVSVGSEWDDVAELGMEIVSVDQDLGIQAGELRLKTANSGFSLGDRLCLALAKREALPVLTADRPWADLNIGVEVRLIR